MSLNVQIACPYCKRPITASLASVGQRVACPNCRGEVQLNPAALLAPSGAAGRTTGSVGGGELPHSTAPPGAATTIVLPPAPPAARPPQPPVAPPANPALLTASTTRPKLAVPAAHAYPPGASPPGSTQPPPPPPATPPPTTASTQRPLVPHTVAGPAPGAASVTLPPAPPPVHQSRTAQFLPASAQASAIEATADGKLPTLHLADSPDAAAPEKSESAPMPLWMALLAVVASTAISLLFLTHDFEGTQSAQKSKVQARRELAAFYGNDLMPLAPFQVHLREAQLAHSRGDLAAERDRYRRVLRLLRAERRSKYDFLTGTPSGDEELARLLSTLLSTD